MEEFYERIELLTKDIDNTSLKSSLLVYMKSNKSIVDYYNSDNELLRNRIINDHIFTELVFDRIISNINNNNYEKAIYLLKKETLRLRMILRFFDKGIYTEDVMTQDKALDTLVEYQKQYLKKSGIRVGKKYNFNDLNLTDNDISRISCMVIHPALIENDNRYYK